MFRMGSVNQRCLVLNCILCVIDQLVIERLVQTVILRYEASATHTLRTTG